METLKFSQIQEYLQPISGLYEIYMTGEIPLKVGIAKNLKKRLSAHKKSKQKRLVLKVCNLGYVLENVASKQSILAKHLYFDSSLTSKYDLKTEEGRISFLERECYIKIQYTPTRECAREIELKKERSGIYRYIGKVKYR